MGVYGDLNGECLQSLKEVGLRQMADMSRQSFHCPLKFLQVANAGKFGVVAAWHLFLKPGSVFADALVVCLAYRLLPLHLTHQSYTMLPS